VAERIAIDSYRQMIEYISGDDPTTRRMLEEITAKKKSMRRISRVCSQNQWAWAVRIARGQRRWAMQEGSYE
jgi:hypothetical protein